MIDQATVEQALSTVKYPGYSRDIMSFKLVKGIKIEDGVVHLAMSLTTTDQKVAEQIYRETQESLRALDGVEDVRIEMEVKEPTRSPGEQQTLQSKIPGVKHVIAVASGKGGVGKSTVSANLAIALSKTGARVGLCDCDLYGPSIAMMFGSDESPMVNRQEQFVPVRRYGLQLMSMGFLTGDDQPVIWRGPMVNRHTQMFLRNVAWEDLDYLVLDLPPGTGDIQLTIVQTVELTGAVIVTTPQEVALIDARKAVSMFRKVNVPILGIVENMSYFVCPNDGNRYHIFGEGGGKREAQRLQVPLLGELPIDMDTREAGDLGQPIAMRKAADSASSAVFDQVASGVIQGVEAQG